MEQASNLYRGERGGGPSLTNPDDSAFTEQGKHADSEILIRKGFESDVNRGI
ncbi:hypothetical protein [Dyadobacter sp. CY323]|uniref:hypothetical protein n=1 Tax=Dyadobacter sp. CY323 TaxID=2907302 RepID=UPI001F1C0957|nr:hypothetical protein [Dyadobacter sp. CY323]MCE6990159.1 hypothetical protein [Dyadobacter sp. CY323]